MKSLIVRGNYNLVSNVMLGNQPSNEDIYIASYAGYIAQRYASDNGHGWGIYAYTDLGGGNCSLTDAFLGAGDVNLTVPGTVNGLTVTALGNHCLSSLMTGVELDSVILPDTITEMGQEALARNNLTSIAFPASLQHCDDMVLHSNSLISVTVPAGVTFADSAFMANATLTSVTISPGVTTIPRYMFAYCTSLTSITLPPSVTSIRAYAFEGCGFTGHLVIPEHITVLEGAWPNNTISEVTMLNRKMDIADSYYSTIFQNNQANPADLIIHGYKGSEAQTLATSRGFTFDPLLVQVGTIGIQTSSGALSLPVYEPNALLNGRDQLRMQSPDGVGCFELVDVSDSLASPLRVQTSGGVKAVAKLI
jgi:hypothetical protein